MIKAVGLDTRSLDYGESELFETHQILFEKNIPGFENVAYLDQLPSTGAFVINLPMKIKDGRVAPLRIVAHLRNRVLDSPVGVTISGICTESCYFRQIYFFPSISKNC